jgi:hypothetical protein
MENFSYDIFNAQYDFMFYVHLQLKNNYDCDNSNNPYNFAFTQR